VKSEQLLLTFAGKTSDHPGHTTSSSGSVVSSVERRLEPVVVADVSGTPASDVEILILVLAVEASAMDVVL